MGEALKREIYEETGFRVEFRRVLGVDVSERPARLDIWLEYGLVGGEFRPSTEVSEASFLATDSVPSLLPAQRTFLSALARKSGRVPGNGQQLDVIGDGIIPRACPVPIATPRLPSL